VVQVVRFAHSGWAKARPLTKRYVHQIAPSVLNQKEVAMKKQRMEFEGFGMKSVCNYHVFDHNDQKYLVIEQLKDTTTSITNRIEALIVDICKMEKLKEPKTKIFEYYPTSTLGGQYLYETRGVKFLNDDLAWFPPMESDVALIKNLVIPG